MGRVAYFMKESVANIACNRKTSVVCIVTTAFTLCCFGAFLLLYVNVRQIVQSFQDQIKVLVYLDDSLVGAQQGELVDRLKRDPEVAGVRFISKEQALAEFRTLFPQERELFEGLESNPLPASFEVSIASGYRSSEAVKAWAGRLKGVPGVEHVQFSGEWIEHVAAAVQSLQLGALILGLFLSVSAVTIVASTIRLTFYARRQEMEVLQLVGATRFFIKFPYVLEGAMLGMVGGAVSLLLLKSGFEWFRSQASGTVRVLLDQPTVAFLPLSVCVGVVMAGVILGGLGGLVSLGDLGEGDL
jgi:cell division transport system permease protein